MAAASANDGQDRNAAEPASPFLIVLGTAQDAGYPAAGCRRPCCAPAWDDVTRRRHVSCLGLVDPRAGGRWLIDCTPDFPAQLHALNDAAQVTERTCPSGILLTHAHVGHYTGLMHLGREAIDSRAVPVYAMPRMRAFLEHNEPWRGLVQAGNIKLRELVDRVELALSEGGDEADLFSEAADLDSQEPRLCVTPITVPHRDEHSETVAFIISGPRRLALYVPDVDGWEQWGRQLDYILAAVDRAYLDGTFYSGGELGGRDMSTVPHPCIADSIARFAALSKRERAKLRFLHFNHTNPVLRPGSEEAEIVAVAGHRLADEGERFEL